MARIPIAAAIGCAPSVSPVAVITPRRALPSIA
jgi:hypothetical protein